MAAPHFESELDEVERECQAILAALELPAQIKSITAQDDSSVKDPEPSTRSSHKPEPGSISSADSLTSSRTRKSTDDSTTADTRQNIVEPSPDRQTGPVALRTGPADARTSLAALDPNIVAALPVTPGELITLSTGERIDPCSLLLNSVSPDWTEAMLQQHFAQFGDVVRARVVQPASSSCWAIVTMRDPYQAYNAKNFSHHRINGETVYQIAYSPMETHSLTHSRHRPPDPLPVSDTVHVAPIDLSWSEEDVRSMFSKVGRVLAITIKSASKNHQYAFIVFGSPSGAQRAVYTFNDTPTGHLSNERFFVTFARTSIPTYSSRKRPRSEDRERERPDTFRPAESSSQPPPIGATLYVEPIFGDPPEERVAARFEQYGSVLGIRMRQKTAVRGYAFVAMSSAEEAKRAIKGLNGIPAPGGETEPLCVRSAYDPWPSEQGPRGLDGKRPRYNWRDQKSVEEGGAGAREENVT